MRPEDIIIKPIITEKSNDGLQDGKYTFKVNKKATKVDIARAVEKLFDVKVIKVNTITVKGKQKRVGVHVGRTSDWKKAIVTIDTNPSEKTYLAKGGKVTKISKKYKDSIDFIIVSSLLAQPKRITTSALVISFVFLLPLPYTNSFLF